MFTIIPDKTVQSDIPCIVGNYEILHFDEEPILFTGTNRYDTRLIASAVDVDLKQKKSRFFFVSITPELYKDFLHQSKSYLDILHESEAIYVVDESFDKSTTEIYLLNLEDIPKDFLPLADSFCPIQSH